MTIRRIPAAVAAVLKCAWCDQLGARFIDDGHPCCPGCYEDRLDELARTERQRAEQLRAIAQVNAANHRATVKAARTARREAARAERRARGRTLPALADTVVRLEVARFAREAALAGKAPNGFGAGRRVVLYAWNGETRTWAGWCEHFGMTRQGLWKARKRATAALVREMVDGRPG